MRIWYVLAAWVFFFLNEAMASPASLTYQGRILKSDGTPLQYSNVGFIFKITDPSGLCVIYQEQVNGIDMTNSGGVFDVPIGQGTVSWPSSGSLTVLDAFNNSATFTCQGGSTYSASANDLRKLRVQFYDGSGWQTISPDSTIRSVPFAGYSYSAAKLGNNVASDFLLKAGLPTCSAGSFLSWDGTALSCATVSGANGGTVTNVSGNAPISVTNNTSTPVVSIAQASTSTNGYLSSTDWNTFNNKQPAGNYVTALTGDVTATGPGSATATLAKLQGSTLTITTPANKDYLKYNGTAFVNAPLAATDLSGTVPAANMPAFSGDVTSSAGSTVLTLATSGVAAGTYKSVTVDAKGRVTAGTNPTTLSGYGITDAVQKAGDSMSGNLTFASGKGTVFTDSTSNTVSLQAPGTVTSYVLKLPAAQGSANQMLTNDGSGNLSWTSLSSLGVTSVSVTSPITNSGSATAPNIGIQQANGSQNGYLSSSDWTTFNNKQSTSLTSANIWVGNGSNVATAVAPSGDVSMTNTGAFTVTGLRGKTVSATAPSVAGQVLRYDGTSTYTPAFLGLADIRATITPFGGAFANSACTAGQSMYWQSSTDTFQCQSIAINDSQLSFTTSRAANTFLAAPSGGSGAASFRTIASADLPAGTLSGSGAAGYLPYYNTSTTLTNSPVYTTGSNVGIGTTAPNRTLDVESTGTAGLRVSSAQSTSSYFEIIDNGAAQATINKYTASGPMQLDINPIASDGSSAAYVRLFRSTNTTGARALQLMKGDGTANVEAQISVNGTNSWLNTTGGSVGIGTNNPASTLHVDNGYITTQRYGSTGALVLRSAAGTQSAATAISAADSWLGYVSGRGYDGANYQEKGAIGFKSDGAISSTSSPGYITFSTTPSGSVASSERIRITSTGYVGIGTPNPAGLIANTNINLGDTGTIGSIAGNGIGPGGLSWQATGGGYVANLFNSGAGVNSNGLQVYTTTTDAASYVLNARSNGASRFVVRADGNVGVGTASPGQNLTLQGRSGSATMLQIQNSDYVGSSTGSGLYLGTVGASGNVASQLQAYSTGNTVAAPLYLNPFAGNVAVGLSNSTTADKMLTVNGDIAVGMDKAPGTYGYGNALWFRGNYNNTDDMWIAKYDVSSDLSYLRVNIGDETSDYFVVGSSTGGSPGGTFNNAFWIKTDGSGWIAGTLTQASDARLKKNIHPLENALDNITRLEGVTYNWIDKRKPAAKQLGLIAQEVEKVYPEAVANNDDGYKSVAYQNLVAPLISAMKEVKSWLLSLTQKSEDHEARLKALEEHIQQQDERIRLLEEQNQLLRKAQAQQQQQ